MALANAPSAQSLANPPDMFLAHFNGDPGTTIRVGHFMLAPFDCYVEEFMERHSVVNGADLRIGICMLTGVNAIGTSTSLVTGEALVVGGVNNAIDVDDVAADTLQIKRLPKANDTDALGTLIPKGALLYFIFLDKATGLAPTAPAAGLGVVSVSARFRRNRAA